ncbi:hypothetical protein CFL29_004301 [Salmonella enterica]|nr:hypothetical protein [Salmonella enterica]EBT2374101.1 hypothetical protein [Salmonella enterica]ECK6280617.1 hypothetical protein [Salmonella enterica]EDQ7381023.1 hypothetical protein [Salmonella enterica subsp. diarizonae serovar 35:l,v:z35]EDQ7909048.1 hypothetical protein [Salmonella enterica]
MLVEQPIAVFVNSVDLENLFCQINADSLNAHDGRSAQVVTIYHPTVAQDVGGDHFINKALPEGNPALIERSDRLTKPMVEQKRQGYEQITISSPN